MLASLVLAQQAPTAGPYKVLKTVKVGGEGGFDYVFADVVGRRLYVPRSGPTARITVFDLDTLEPPAKFPMSMDTELSSTPRRITASSPAIPS